MRILLALLLVVVAGSARADDLSALVGQYTGTIDSGSPGVPSDTVFALKNGQLIGHYVMHEDERDVPGTLTFVESHGPAEQVMTWSDLYGSGPVTFRFKQDFSGFTGVWSDDAGPAGKWTGTRTGG